MLRSLFGLNRRKSPPHLLLLSKFRAPQPVEVFKGSSDVWHEVLREDVFEAIRQYHSEGLLQEADIAQRLDASCKVSELQALLKHIGVTSTGRKSELIGRLVAEDPIRAKSLAGAGDVLVVSAEGGCLAEQYLAEERLKRTAAEEHVWNQVAAHKFQAASNAVAQFEAEQVFPRGMGIDWKHHDPTHDVERLQVLFKSQPRILADIQAADLGALRMAAAMMTLWGTNSGKKWLPDNYMKGGHLDVDPTIRMFAFFAWKQAAIQEYRRSGVVDAVEVSATADSCDACKRLSGSRFALRDAIELPYEHCTHKKGCRCTWLPVARGADRIR